MSVQDEFILSTPTSENYMRGIVLFGRNVASYKFALAKSILELAAKDNVQVSLEDLAVPFSTHLCEHLKAAPKQATSSSSKFLDACRRFNDGKITSDALRDDTVRLGFNNVIDAFHIVGAGEIPDRFFVDERNGPNRVIQLTDQLHQVASRTLEQALAEIEARWRLVESAWAMDISSSLISYETATGLLVPATRRKALTSPDHSREVRRVRFGHGDE
jgi:hypothetical protein